MRHRETILLVDDHQVVRAGFRSLLTANDDFVVLEAASAEEGIELFRSHNPDLVVMDISMPGMGGFESIRRILARDPSAKIVVLSMYDDHSYIENTRQLGVMGYITKRSAPGELLSAISAVLQGQQYFSKDLNLDNPLVSETRELITALSKREFEIFTLLAEGRSVVKIAEDLVISPKTVSNHRDAVMRKLNLANIAELTRCAIRHGIMIP